MVKPSLLLEIQTGRTNSEYPRTFLRRYLCNRSPEMRTKNFKNFISVLAIVNYQNWMDASPPVNFVSIIILKIRKRIDFIVILTPPVTFVSFITKILYLCNEKQSENKKFQNCISILYCACHSIRNK